MPSKLSPTELKEGAFLARRVLDQAHGVNAFAMACEKAAHFGSLTIKQLQALRDAVARNDSRATPAPHERKRSLTARVNSSRASRKVPITLARVSIVDVPE